jgi:predicted enzyme related to lactoylglutathione lyase
MNNTGTILVNIDVDDLPRATEFYVRAFGWSVARRLGSDVVELMGGGVPVYLVASVAGSIPAPNAAPRDYQRHWTPVHLDVVVADLDAALARAEGAGARREAEPATHAWGRIVRLADPFGHGVCLVQFHGRGYDEIVTEPPPSGAALKS